MNTNEYLSSAPPIEPGNSANTLASADPGTPSSKPKVDEFNPEAFRLGQNFAKGVVTERIATRIACRKPTRHEWFRVHPGDDMYLDAAVLDLKVAGTSYLVDPIVIPAIASDVVPKRIVLAVNRNAVAFLWGVKLPDSRGQLDQWSESAQVACEHAKTTWIRMGANMAEGAYEIHAAPDLALQPAWPMQSFTALLKLAFADRFIRTVDHPVVRELNGEL